MKPAWWYSEARLGREVTDLARGQPAYLFLGTAHLPLSHWNPGLVACVGCVTLCTDSASQVLLDFYKAFLEISAGKKPTGRGVGR